MNSKLFKPLNEQIQVVKIKRQGIDDAERDSLIESIINESVVESLTEDVDMAALYEQCLIEAGYDEARADELLLEFLGLSRMERNQKWINKNKNKRTVSYKNKDASLYNDVATKYAKDDKKALDDIANRFEQAKDAANRMSGKTFGERWAKKKALKQATKDAQKELLAHNKETYKRNKIEVNDIKKSQGTRDMLASARSDNDKLVKEADKKDMEKVITDVVKGQPKDVFMPNYTNTKSDHFKPVVTDKSVKAKEDMEKVITDVVKGQPKDAFMPNYTNTKSDHFKPITYSQGNEQSKSADQGQESNKNNNSQDDFEKRVNAEVEKRYKERQDAITAKRKATYEANRAKKAAETANPVEPVKEVVSNVSEPTKEKKDTTTEETNK